MFRMSETKRSSPELTTRKKYLKNLMDIQMDIEQQTSGKRQTPVPWNQLKKHL